MADFFFFFFLLHTSSETWTTHSLSDNLTVWESFLESGIRFFSVGMWKHRGNYTQQLKSVWPAAESRTFNCLLRVQRSVWALTQSCYWSSFIPSSCKDSTADDTKVNVSIMVTGFAPLVVVVLPAEALLTVLWRGRAHPVMAARNVSLMCRRCCRQLLW